MHQIIIGLLYSSILEIIFQGSITSKQIWKVKHKWCLSRYETWTSLVLSTWWIMYHSHWQRPGAVWFRSARSTRKGASLTRVFIFRLLDVPTTICSLTQARATLPHFLLQYALHVVKSSGLWDTMVLACYWIWYWDIRIRCFCFDMGFFSKTHIISNYSHSHKGMPFPGTADTSTSYAPDQAQEKLRLVFYIRNRIWDTCDSTIKTLGHQMKLDENAAEGQGRLDFKSIYAHDTKSWKWV